MISFPRKLASAWNRGLCLIQNTSFMHRLALTLLAGLALWLRLRGVDWPRYHPDEYPIAHWIMRGTPDRVYPGGLFVLIQPFRHLWVLVEDWMPRLGLFWGHSGLVPNTQTDFILMGRVFNALLGSLTTVIVALTARRITGHRGMALLAGLFFCFAQLHVEHAHYAQTDIPMVFMLSLTLWAWVRHVEEPRLRWFILTGLLCGASAGTKFTLNVLFLPWLLYAVWTAWNDGSGRLRRLAGMLPGAVVCFALGILLTNPNLSRWSWFMEGLAHERSRVYGETVANMGALAGDIRLRWLSHVMAWGRTVQTLGEGWIALWALGIPALFFTPARKYWIPLLGLPALYTVYWIFVAPWVRTQEFLNYLPFAAILAVMPLQLLIHKVSCKGVRAFGVLVVAAALAITAQRGLRSSSVFTWMDTRLQAERWLQRHEPDGLHVGRERYATVTPRGVSHGADMAARLGVERARERGLDLFLSQGTPAHRGMDHPVTKELYPRYAESLERFWAETDHLKSWSLLPERSTRTTFNSIQVEMLGMDPGEPQAEWPWRLPQPGWRSELPYETFHSHGIHLGSFSEVEVSSTPRTVGVTSRHELEDPVYLLLYTRERAATVRVRGFGGRKRVDLGPYDLQIVPLQRPWWRPRISHVERVRLRADPVRHIHRIPCFARVVFTEADLNRVLADLQPLRTAVPEPPAMEMLRQWESIRELPPQKISYQGISAAAYNLFARFHLLNPLDHDANKPETLYLGEQEDPQYGGTPYGFRWRTSLRRAAEPSTLRLHMRIQPLEHLLDDDQHRIHFRDEATGVEFGSMKVSPDLVSEQEVELSIPPGSPGPLELRIESTHPFEARLTRAELSRDFHQTLAASVDEAALRHLSREPDSPDAEPLLAHLTSREEELGPRQLLSFRRLRFEQAVKSGMADPELRELAEALLEVAPAHARARGVIDGTPATDAEPSDSPAASWYGWIRVVSQEVLEDRDQAEVTFEVLQDNLPPLAATSLRRRRGEWRTIERVSILPPRAVAKGERFTVTLPLRGGAHSLSDRGLAVDADTPWVAGRLTLDHDGSEAIALDEL